MILSPILRNVAFSTSFINKSASWGGNGLFNRNSTLHALANSCRGYAVKFTGRRPVRVINPVNRNGFQISLIFGGLLNACGPTTISSFVVPIAVKPINGMVKARPFTHISKELYKRFIPFRANYNAPSSIFWIIFKVNVPATSFHAYPYAIGRASLSTDFMAMLQAPVRISHVPCIAGTMNKGSAL